MASKRSVILMVGFSILLVCFGGSREASGQRSGSVTSETEVRKLWAAFDLEKDRLEVKGNYPFIKCFKKASEEHNVPLPLLLAVARGESDFVPTAASHKSCYGIMQIRWPGTANDLGIFEKADLFDPCININAGARYLAGLMKRFDGNAFLAVAAYNYGPNAIGRGSIPEGAVWYAAYIHRHLQHVTAGGENSFGRMLILRFTFYRQASEFISYLEKRGIGIPLEIYKSRQYTYDVFLTYQNLKQRQKYIEELMKVTGIKPMGEG